MKKTLEYVSIFLFSAVILYLGYILIYILYFDGFPPVSHILPFLLLLCIFWIARHLLNQEKQIAALSQRVESLTREVSDLRRSADKTL